MQRSPNANLCLLTSSLLKESVEGTVIEESKGVRNEKREHAGYNSKRQDGRGLFTCASCSARLQ